MGCSKILALVMVVVMATTRGAEGQSTPTPSCVSKLTPCANYINATNPPASCCDPLRDAVTNELVCLCNLFNTPGLLASLHINMTDAVNLPGHCNIKGDLSACSKASAPSSPTPPATPGKDSGAGKIASTGMASILLFWASVMLY